MKIKIIHEDEDKVNEEVEVDSAFILGLEQDSEGVETFSGFVGNIDMVTKAVMEREIKFRLEKERIRDFGSQEKREGKNED